MDLSAGEIDRLFDRFIEPRLGALELGGEWMPRLDLSETKDAYVAKLEVLGVDPKEMNEEPFDDSKYKTGDEVPSIVVAAFTGDRGDIAVKSVWKDGTWTLVFWRKPVTKSDFDVQLSDMKKPYAFGVAVFDKAQVRHAYVPGGLKLVFE
jgi:hypothetical protein